MFAFYISIINVGEALWRHTSIVINEVTYGLIACTQIIKFKNIFMEHFSPDQFGVVICGRCEIVVHGI
jgi:hypothetical protein